MVQVADALPLDAYGAIDIAPWCDRVAARYPGVDTHPLADACGVVQALPDGQKLLERGLTLAELVASLTRDTEALLAALLYRARREQALSSAEIAQRWGDTVAGLVEGVEAMAAASLLELSNAPLLASEQQDQVENVRRLLVSMVDDARVAVIKIAERVVVMRMAKYDQPERQRRISREAQEVFAPLAGRLGVWHLKWELEDLALRYLEPQAYSDIAHQLDGRRMEREAQVAEIAQRLQGELAERGISARVYGRAKHIFSIWRKMHAKGVSFEEVYDMRAVRILVDDLAACYASLGVVHSHYQHLPMEFDDYIAAPKDNGYRSIHTAVVGPDGKTLEVQIRTQEMHEEAELGVCAHWGYKGDGDVDPSYGAKMDWLRQVVEWHDDEPRRLTEELRANFHQDRIFVHTPKGHVIDLSNGATPLDFAYRVHTDIGHRCVGALVDGTLTALDAPLVTGQRVQVLTDPTHEPERRWLEPGPYFVRTARARSKIQSWLRARGEAVNEQAGRSMLSDVCHSLCLPEPDSETNGMLLRHFRCDDEAGFYAQLGVGELQLEAVVRRWCERFDRVQTRLDLPAVEEEGTTHRLVLTGGNRDGLLLDTSRLLSERNVSLHGLNGRLLGDDRAEITLDFAAPRLIDVYRVLVRLAALAGVERVFRVEA